MEFWRLYRIIRKRRWLILIGMLICVSFVEYKNVTSVPLYKGRTTVMESDGMAKDSIPLYPQQYMQMDTQLRLSNLVRIATSRKVMENAAATLQDLHEITIPVQDILSNTVVSPEKDTNIIAIEVTLPDHELAASAAGIIAFEFKRVYGELNNASVRQSREFIEGQLETTRKAMVNAQSNLRKFKEENGIISLDAQTTEIIQRISQAKNLLAQSKASSQAANASLAKIASEVDGLPETYVSAKQINRDPLWQDLQTRLTALETEHARMLGVAGQSRRGKNHPDVQAIQRQIDQVKDQLVGIKENYLASSTETKNPNKTGAIDRWIVAKVEAVSESAKTSALESIVAETSSELATLPADEAKLASLQTEIQSAYETYALMRKKLDEARISEEQAKNKVAIKTVEEPYWMPVRSQATLKLILALILSPILGIGVALLLHYVDNTVKTSADAEKLFGLPVYTEIPGARAHSLVRQKCPEALDVAYQMLTSNLWILSQNHGVKSFAMVSAEPDAGRSVTASNLAVTLCREGARVILVDADLRQPVQHMIFGVDDRVGLTNLLSGSAALEDVLVPTKTPGLLLIPSGPTSDNPVKLLRSEEMKDMVEQVSGIADFVIYDTPAGVSFPDAVLVTAYVGNALVTHAAGRVPRGSELDLNARLESVNAKIWGVALNKVKREDSSGYFHYRRSYQGIYKPKLPAGRK